MNGDKERLNFDTKDNHHIQITGKKQKPGFAKENQISEVEYCFKISKT